MLTAAHFLIAVVEFFLVNWLGKHSISSGYHQISFVQATEDAPLFNVVFRVMAPSVYLVLTAVLLYEVGWDGLLRQYWVVTVWYFVVRWMFNLAMGRAKLLNWPKQILTACAAIGLSYLVVLKLVSDKKALLPSAQGLTDQIWIVVIGFLYVTAGRVTWPAIGRSAADRKRDFIRVKYWEFRRRYGSVIVELSASRAAEALSYAILIYESFNRPPLYQWLEEWILFPLGLAKSLGPMQVRTKKRLSKPALVSAGVTVVNRALEEALDQARREYPQELTVQARRNLEEGYEEPYSPGFDVHSVSFEKVPSYFQDWIVRTAAERYNVRSDYPGEIVGIFEVIRDSYYPDLHQGLLDNEMLAT